MKVEMKVSFYPGDRGVFLGVDAEKCTCCGRCAKYCARNVWAKDGDVYRPTRPEACVECGACWNVCTAGAVMFGEPAGGTGVRFSYG